jgi:hypothetical protein
MDLSLLQKPGHEDPGNAIKPLGVLNASFYSIYSIEAENGKDKHTTVLQS